MKKGAENAKEKIEKLRKNTKINQRKIERIKMICKMKMKNSEQINNAFLLKNTAKIQMKI